MMILGLLSQEALDVGTPLWASIPSSVQTLAGAVAIFGAGWTWFIRPRMTAIVTEIVGRSEKKLLSDIAKNRDAIAENRKEIAKNREAIASNGKEIAKNREAIGANRGEITKVRAELRKEVGKLSGEIGRVREDLRGEIGKLREELRGELGGTREEVGENRNSITALRDLISESRIETRDLLAKMREENNLAHAAIGDRITGLQTYIAEDNKSLRKEMADMRADTARLSGAVDVLTGIWREDAA